VSFLWRGCHCWVDWVCRRWMSWWSVNIHKQRTLRCLTEPLQSPALQHTTLNVNKKWWCSFSTYANCNAHKISAWMSRRSRARVSRHGKHGVSSRRCDVTDSERIVYSVCSHLSYCEWSSADTRQMQLCRSVMYNWRPLWQTTMSHGTVIPLTSIVAGSRCNVSAANVKIVDER